MLSRRALLAAPLLLLPSPSLATGLGFEATPHGLKIAATTVWGESRGEKPRGRLAVANVIVTRVLEARIHQRRTGRPHPVFGPGTLEGVCLAPFQFSVWLRRDVNYPKLAKAPSHPLYPDCMKAVVSALNMTEPDPSHGANHYFDHGSVPHWARKRKPTAVIGNHTFYRL